MANYEEKNSLHYDEAVNTLSPELESLITSVTDFNHEMLRVIGKREEHKLSINQNQSDRLDFVNHANNAILKRLSDFDASIQMHGIIYNFNNAQKPIAKKLKYKPEFALQFSDLELSYKSGTLFDTCILSDSTQDYMRLLPSVKVIQELDNKKIVALTEVINTVTAELTQHVYKAPPKRVSQPSPKMKSYLGFIEKEEKKEILLEKIKSAL